MRILLVTLVVGLMTCVGQIAFAQNGRLVSEEKSGLHKTCVYDTNRGNVSKTVSSYERCPRSLSGGSNYGAASSGIRGRNIGEKTSGLNKICYYDSARGEFTKTIRSTGVCPVSATY